MLARLTTRQDDDGFTLIELLVVIIIIGILAAIAIPVFLNQRKKGYDAQAKSDARNAATLEETYLADYFTYTAQTDATTAPLNARKSANVTTLSVKTYANGSHGSSATTGTTQSGGYCITAASASGNSFYYDSTTGGFTTAGCP